MFPTLVCRSSMNNYFKKAQLKLPFSTSNSIELHDYFGGDIQ